MSLDTNKGTSDSQDNDFLTKVINEYLHGESANGRPAAAGLISNQKHFKRQEIIQALTGIQTTYKPAYIPGKTVNINTDEFKSALLNSMANLSNAAMPRSMNQIDGRTIDFVEMIFGAFLRDPNLSASVKRLLLKLQIPVIKTSLMDSGFFFEMDHPARKMLNGIANLGIGMDDEAGTLYQTIELIIDQLLRGFDQNMASFSTALTSLSRLKNIENKKSEENETTTRQMLVIEHAKQLVLTELQYYTMKVKLPKAIQPLILSNWSTLLFQRYIKHGKESDQWKEGISILKLLISSLKPVNSTDDWLSLNAIHEHIADTIKSNLENTRQNKDKINQAITSLEQHYRELLASSPYAPDADQVLEVDSDEALQSLQAKAMEMSPSPNDEREREAEVKLRQLPECVTVNSWFEIHMGANSSVRRLKLAVINLEKASLVFVDRKGIKVLEKDAELFSREIESGESRLIEDRNAFEFALHQVINKINR